MGFARAIATNTAWLLIGKALVVILSLVMTAALARSLGVYHYGELTAAFAYLSIFGVIADFGFFQILVREITRQPEAETRITNNLFTLRTLFGFVVYVLAAGSVWLIPTEIYSLNVKLGVLVLALASFVLSINTTLIGVFQAHQEMQKAVIGDVVSRLALLALLLLSLVRGAPLPFIFGLYVLANCLNLLVTFLYLRRRLRLRLAFNRLLWKKLFIEAWPLGVVTMLGVIYFKIDTVILSILRDPTDVGIYGAPYKVFEFLAIVPGIFMGTVFPVITRLMDLDRDRLRRVIQGAYDALMLLVIAAVAGLLVLAPAIVNLVAGQEFVTATTVTFAGYSMTAIHVLAVLALALVSVYIGNLWGPVVVAYGRQSELIRPGVIAVLANIALNMLLIPRGSYVAAAAVTLLTETYMAVSWARAAGRLLTLKLDHSRLIRSILAALVMVLTIWPIRSLPIILPMIVGSAIYVLSLWLLGAFPWDLLTSLRSAKGKI